ncbi:MAG: 6-carboxytetrahydropterin synthase, partial [Desulfobulbaceae bacterium]|nr:6-carboxytetrahydropterin synthase [Desulfobulbaceae bacterium]
MRGVFEIVVQSHFSAAHSLRGYAGDCARTHGHNWIIEVYVRCRELNEI